MQRIAPFLWFDTQAEEAAQFYVSIFPNSKVVSTSRYGKNGPGPEGAVMVAAFELDGQRFVALNGGPQYKFSPAVSFVVHCETQQEIDAYWEKLSSGGSPSRCGWLQDRYGLSWQVVPSTLERLLGSGDAVRTNRVMQAVMGMQKLDIAAMTRAFEGR